MGGGKERKIIDKSTTNDQVKDRGERLKQKLFQTESAIKNILSKRLSAHYDTEYLGFTGIK
jgi:peptide methionine sulfoxide reductase MsrA